MNKPTDKEVKLAFFDSFAGIFEYIIEDGQQQIWDGLEDIDEKYGEGFIANHEQIFINLMYAVDGEIKEALAQLRKKYMAAATAQKV